jgi:heptosyltransferase-2
MRKRTAAEVAALAGRNDQSRQTFNPEAHHLHNYLHLAEALGASPEALEPRIYITANEAAEVRARFGITGKNLLLGLNPGAEYGSAKRWPLERFVETAVLVQGKHDVEWLIFGGKGDAGPAGELESTLRARASESKVRNLAGQTSLRQLAVLASQCGVVLTNDTGPMHVAAAAGSRVVVPFGSTSPELTGPGLPGGSRHALLTGQAACAPCFRRECPIDFRCMTSLHPDVLAGRILRLIDEDSR